MAGNKNSGRRPRPKKKVPHVAITPPEGSVVKPKRLTHIAGDVWDDLAPLAIKMGTLTAADVVAFATLCELEASRWAIVKAKDDESFMPLRVGKDYKGNDSTLEDQAFESEREAVKALEPWLIRFGLDPSGLGRVIEVPHDEKVKSAAPPKKADVRDFAARARERLKVAGRG